MCIHGSPSIYTLSPQALGVYIMQTTCAHGITIRYILCISYNTGKSALPDKHTQMPVL